MPGFISTLWTTVPTGMLCSGSALPGLIGASTPLMIGVPDRFVEHGTRRRLLEKLGFTPAGLAERILQGFEAAVEAPLSA